jgi:membrane associated rhomboid family serine protease
MTQASVGHHCPECVSGQGQTVYRPQALLNQRPPVTMTLIAINLIAYFGQLATVGTLTRWGWLFGPDVADGEWWRTISAGFLHGGFLHIGFNMYALWIFGPTLERGIGSMRFGLIYLAGLLGGTAAVLAFDYTQTTLGASGAVLGLAGGIAAVLMARGVNIFQTSLGTIFLLNLALPLLVPRISFWGHAGGIAAGFAAGLLLAWLPERMGQSGKAAVAVTAFLCLGLFTLSLVLGESGGLGVA